MSLTTNSKQLDRLARSQKEEARKRQADWRHLMSEVSNRRLIYRFLFVDCELQSAVSGAPSTYLHEREGARNVAAKLAQYLQENCAQEWVTMVAESIQSRSEELRELKDAAEKARQENDE